MPILPSLPGLHDLVARFDQVRRAAALRADLHHALILARRGQHRLAFGHIHADRLLAVDIAAGLYRLDHRQRMPVVGRRDQDDVQVLLAQHLAVVVDRCAASSSRPAGSATISAASRQHVADPHRRARPPRPARPESAAAGRPCRTSRSQSGQRGGASHPRRGGSARRRKNCSGRGCG